MLQKVDSANRSEAVTFLQITLEFAESHIPQLDFLDYALMTYEKLNDLWLSPQDFSSESFELHCQTVKTRIPTICSGLLELQQKRHYRVEDQAEAPQRHPCLLEYYQSLEVVLHHRTIKDFLTLNPEGTKFIEKYLPRRFQPYPLYFRASLAKTLYPTPYVSWRSATHLLLAIILDIKLWLPKDMDADAMQVVDQIDNTGIVLSHQHSLQHDKHWTAHLARKHYYEPNPYAKTAGTVPPDQFFIENPTANVRRSIPFVNFATYAGLLPYVQQVVRSSHLSKFAASYLLGGALVPHPFPDLIVSLLQSGADPNMSFAGKTPWSVLLTFVAAVGTTSEWRLNRQDLETVLNTLIEYGANVNEILEYTDQVSCRPTLGRYKAFFRLPVSALLSLILGNTHDSFETFKRIGACYLVGFADGGAIRTWSEPQEVLQECSSIYSVLFTGSGEPESSSPWGSYRRQMIREFYNEILSNFEPTSVEPYNPSDSDKETLSSTTS